MRKRLLPPYCSAFRDRHGKERIRFRRTGKPTIYAQAQPGSEEFRAEYYAWRDGAKLDPGAERTAPGTIADLVARYYRSQSFNNAKAVTQRKNRGILDAFRAEHGGKTVTNIQFEHVDAMISKKAKAHPAAAVNLRKQLRRLFDHAVRLRMRPDNPIAMTAAVRNRSKGHHTWTEDEIALYRAHWSLGSKQRLAMELLLWTDQRKSDMVRMGRQHVRDGRIRVQQDKGDKVLWIPIAPQLAEAVASMKIAGHLTFLVTDYGQPFSVAGFGNRFRAWCNAAGLPHCSAHGLRKATLRRAAEIGVSQQGLKSIGGHSGDAEVALYVREASQTVQADAAMKALSEWELATLSQASWLTQGEDTEKEVKK